jgi:hypothetical protein
MQRSEVTSIKTWLARFLASRGLTRPDGRPLHAYRVTQSEYEQMLICLNECRRDSLTLGRKVSWAAVFCLFVAECYRREYDARAFSWTWSTFERRLGPHVEFNAPQHAELTELGLEGFWERPIRHRGHGRDLLGSLFAEGGLPWLLLQNETHGFGKAIQAGLRNYYRAAAERRSVIDLMGGAEHALPQVFQNLETRQLLAGIVQQLMYLAENFPLHGQTDPSSFLDQKNRGWRSHFPIPLDEANGRRLLNDWLRDAEQRRQERAEEVARAFAFSCTHYLRGDPPHWGLSTELVVPEIAEFYPSGEPLRNTRLELAFFEGGRLLARAGAVYAQPKGSGWAVRFPRTRFSVERRDPASPLNLCLLEAGVPVHSFAFEGDVVEFDELPLVFAPVDDGWQLVATASCSLAAQEVRVRVPNGTTAPGDAGRHIADEADGAYWIESRTGLRCVSGTDVFDIRLNCDAAASPQLTLKGRCLPYESVPGLVYAGWPRLEVPHDYPIAREELREFIDSRPLPSVPMHERFGPVRYSVKGPAGETLLRRRFGVVPGEFEITLRPGVSARVVLLNPGPIVPRVLNAAVKASALRGTDTITLSLEADASQPPKTLLLELQHPAHAGGIELRLPYPYQGATFIDAAGHTGDPGTLVLDDLLGASVVLFSGREGGQLFELQLELFSSCLQQRPWRCHRLQAGEAPLTLNLFNYQHDIAEMLAVVSDQDAYVRLTLMGKQRLLVLDICRYDAGLARAEDGSFVVVPEGSQRELASAKTSAMLLAAPSQPKVMLSERLSEGVGTGHFEVPDEMQKDGPWLLFPDSTSPVLFRPRVFEPAPADAEPAAEPVQSLHEAARLYHPARAPHVMDAQIAAMARDFSHSNWQYLADLRQHVAHLPLSTFHAWIALANNHEALAAAVFRLELDRAFCERIRDELAVIWECVPLPLWLDIHERFRTWLARAGLAENYVALALEHRRAVFGSLAPKFDEFTAYLDSGNPRRLPPAPVDFVLPGWYQTLRQTHCANRDWPMQLGEDLAAWVRQRQKLLPSVVTHLSTASFSDAVCYLPIFMAHVTAGKATLDELVQDSGAQKFALKRLADFDRALWYDPVYALFVSYLLSRG